MSSIAFVNAVRYLVRHVLDCERNGTVAYTAFNREEKPCAVIALLMIVTDPEMKLRGRKQYGIVGSDGPLGPQEIA